MITQETSSSPADSEPCRCGSTTLVTLVSRICMKETIITESVIAHLRVDEIGGGSGAGGVTRVPGAPLRQWPVAALLHP